MMKIYWSPSTAGLYVNSNNTLDDTIAISEEEYISLLDGQCSGCRIVASQAGTPELVSQGE